MPKSVVIHELSKLSRDERAQLLERAEDNLEPYIEKVAPIVRAVREEGDAALVRFAKQFDGADIEGAIAATPADFDKAFDLIEPAMIETLEYSADNIRRFHEKQLPIETWTTEIRPGVEVGERATPIDAVACYAPRGKGAFPSVTLMSCIPAVVAKVPNAILLTPPGPDGTVDAATLVAARISGIEQVYKVGGGQAVAAAAYGTQTVSKCHKIVGPGSPWLMAAKRLLAGRIDPGMPAGPSEVIIFADENANAEVAAMDLIIESEHGSDSSAFCVTTSRATAEHVVKNVPNYWAQMSEERVGYSSDVLSSTSGGVVLCETLKEAYAFINDYAPEHLEILSKDPDQHLPHIRNASEILLGDWAAGSIANYMMGPNCVLPTSAAAKTYSPLGVADFMKRSSIGRMSEEGFREMAPHTHRFATYEGFDAHALAVSDLRLKAMGKK